MSCSERTPISGGGSVVRRPSGGTFTRMPRRRGRRMMHGVRWINGHLGTVAPVTLIVALLGLEPIAAMASPVRRGAWYRGTGRQPHWPARGTGDSSGNFDVYFLATRNGRQVTHLGASVEVWCARKHWTRFPELVDLSAPIRRGSTFRTSLRALSSASPVELTGRFLSRGRARGTLRFRGRGLDKDCNADGTWTAHAWPLPPPMKHFTGRTDQGTRVTFERTIERHPRVTGFNFGRLNGTVSSGGTCAYVLTTGGLEPPWYQFALPVNRGRFSGGYKDAGGATGIDISGRFDAKDRASGTLSYGDRGDCHIHAHWTAHPAG